MRVRSGRTSVALRCSAACCGLDLRRRRRDSSSAVDDRIEVHSSRLWALLPLQLDALSFPAADGRRPCRHFELRQVACSGSRRGVARTSICRCRTSPKSTHTRGFIWDADQRRELRRAESAGRSSDLPKSPRPLLRRARARAASTQAPVTPPQQRRAVERRAPACRPMITTFSPSLMRPERMSSASGSCTDFWITRLSGRAP